MLKFSVFQNKTGLKCFAPIICVVSIMEGGRKVGSYMPVLLLRSTRMGCLVVGTGTDDVHVDDVESCRLRYVLPLQEAAEVPTGLDVGSGSAISSTTANTFRLNVRTCESLN